MSLESKVLRSAALAKRAEAVRLRSSYPVKSSGVDVFMHSLGFGKDERAKRLVFELNEIVARYNQEYAEELRQEFILEFEGKD